MVKGVSKMVIEVNNTGSELFEKVVFYVTPKYGTLSAKQLKKAVSSFSFDYSTGVHKKSRRKGYRLRYKRIALFAAALLLIIAAGAAALTVIL